MSLSMDRVFSDINKIGTISVQVVDKLKIFQKQNNMLLGFCFKFFEYVEKYLILYC